MIERSSGVLLNISSLPGEFGIGGFSGDCVEFAMRIADMGFSWWQILPLTTIGAGNSPYSGASAFAINYLYVDPYGLCEKGLIGYDELGRFRYDGSPYQVDYDHVLTSKRELLRLAYGRIGDDIRAAMEAFLSDNREWLLDYAVYMSICDRHNGASWTHWEDCYKYYDAKVVSEYYRDNKEAVDFYVFEQYILQTQWNDIRRRVQEVGIRFIGDIPMYVGYESVDVWSNPSQFLLDERLKPTKVAGVPPDAFAAHGQLWGNPIYDVGHMAEDGYKWWMNRLKRCFAMYDCLRIDHFRGLYSYWACEPDAETAENGQWYDGLGDRFVECIKATFGSDVNIIAEDLGQIDDEVRAFLHRSGFPGMKVLQFGFPEYDSLHQPHNYQENSVAYTGTHDNDTTLAWLYSLNDRERNMALNYCGYYGYEWGRGGRDCQSVHACIRAVLSSVARLAVIPIQDLCGFGGDTRMNVPGVPDGNWRFRMTYDAFYDADRDYYLSMNELYCRRRH